MKLNPMILDLSGLVKNAYFAGMTPEPLMGETKDKINTATFAFETFLTKFFDPILEIVGSPIHMIAVLDDGNTYRKALFPTYKAKRHSKDQDPVEREQIEKAMAYAKAFLVALGIPLVKLKGQEADDVIGYLVSKLQGNLTVATIDHDLLQLGDRAGLFLNGIHKTEIKSDVPPPLVVLYKSIIGDSSDEYPGVKGVGPKGWESMVEDYGLDGMEQLLGLLSRNQRVEIKAIAASADNKAFRKCAEDYDNWYKMYQLATLHPELCEGATVKLEWYKRCPLKERLVKAMENTGTLDWLDKYEKFTYRPVLVTQDNLDEVVTEIVELTKVTPAVAWDYETFDTVKNPNYLLAAKGKNYVDVLNSAIAGCSFAMGPNFNNVYYFSVRHKDTNNVSQQWVLNMIKHFEEEGIEMVAQNIGFESTVTRMQLSHEIKYWQDTKAYAHHLDENGENGLKHLSKRYLNYDQTSYKETLAAAGAADMSEISGDQVLSYGCDDSLVTGHLYGLFTILTQLEETYDFIHEKECPAVAALIEPYIHGVKLDVELMAKLTEEDTVTTKTKFAEIRSILETNCLNPNLDAVEVLYEDQKDYISYKAKVAVNSKNPDASPSEVQYEIKNTLDSYRNTLKENSRYVMPYEIRNAKEFIPTPVKLTEATTLLGLSPIEKTTKSYLSDWLSDCPDCEFKSLLAAAAHQFGKREGNAYAKLKTYCDRLFYDNAPISMGGTRLNLGSPKQMQYLMYLLLGLPIRVRTKKQKGSLRQEAGLLGSPATDDSALDFALANDCSGLSSWKADLLNALSEYTSAATRLSNYWTPYPLWMGDDHIMHPNFISPGTVTRRPTGTSPNMLQVSKGNVRKCYIPRSKDNVIVSIDFASQELRVMASLTKDENMLKVFREGLDMHSMTGCGIVPLLVHKFSVDPASISMEEGKVVYAWFKEHQNDDSELGYMLRKVRDTSKTVNFGVGYGATGVTVSQQAMIPLEDADLAVSGMLSTYPGISTWKEALYKQARIDGYVKTAYGSRRHCGNNLRTGSRSETSRWERQLSNFEIQGGCADLLKVVLSGAVKTRVFQKHSAYLLAPVYDEILAEVPKVNLHSYLHKMSDLMEVYLPGLEVPMVADCSFGPSWGEQIEVGVRPSLEKVNEVLARI